jgi:L-asparaginase II
MAMVEFYRGEFAESVHQVDAVIVDRQARTQWRTGADESSVYWRSGAKPFQLLPFLAAGGGGRFGLTGEEIAVMASSHSGAKFHVECVQGILQKLQLTAEHLDCGVARPLDEAISRQMFRDGEPYANLHNDCSGKHAGMLGLALLRGYPLAGYKEATHPLQAEMRCAVARAAGLGAEVLGEGVDGCGVPTFYLPLRLMALAYANLAQPEPAYWGDWAESAQRVLSAMTHHPEYVGGEGRYETDLMRLTGGRLVAKLGAEATFCIGNRDSGAGFACKVRDGALRVLPHLCTEVLCKNDWLSDAEAAQMREWYPPLIRNDHGDVVGRIEVGGICG